MSSLVSSVRSRLSVSDIPSDNLPQETLKCRKCTTKHQEHLEGRKKELVFRREQIIALKIMLQIQYDNSVYYNGSELTKLVATCPYSIIFSRPMPFCAEGAKRHY